MWFITAYLKKKKKKGGGGGGEAEFLFVTEIIEGNYCVLNFFSRLWSVPDNAQQGVQWDEP